MSLINKAGKNLLNKKIVKERFGEIKEYTDETNLDELWYYWEKNSYFEDEIKLFEKIKSGGIKQEKDKKIATHV